MARHPADERAHVHGEIGGEVAQIWGWKGVKSQYEGSLNLELLCHGE